MKSSSPAEQQRKLLKRYVDHVVGKVAALSAEDQQALREIEELPEAFLDSATNSALALVASINLSFFTSVTKIGPRFMCGLSKLSSVDFSAFSGVAEIGDNFLVGAAIQSIDLSPFKLVKRLPQDFLTFCDSLQKLDLSCLSSSLESIGEGFCFRCSSLTTVNMSGLTRLKSIGDRFLSPAPLSSIDFSRTSPERIGASFLNLEYSKIQNIDVSDLLSKVSVISKFAFANCDELVELDLSNCCNHVTEIQEDFATYCMKLKKISLSGLISVKHIRENFLTECHSLTELDISCCTKLEIIDESFCAGCTSLQKINMSNLPFLREIGWKFMSSCTALQSVNFEGTNNLKFLRDNAFAGCVALASLDLDFLVHASEIGRFFLKSVTTCQISGLHKLANVEKIEDRALKLNIEKAVERVAVRQMIVRMIYALGFRTSKTVLVPAGKAIRASRPRRLVIEFLLPSASIDTAFAWGFAKVVDCKDFLSEWEKLFG